MSVPAGDYLVDTEPIAVADQPGRYATMIPEAWKVFYLFGGISMGFALRSIEAEIERPDLRPLTASAIFCSPISSGPVEATVDVLRNGRTAAQATASLRVPDRNEPALSMQSTFGVAHDTDLAVQGVGFPDVAPPLECEPPPDERDPDDPFPPVNFHDQTEWRPAMPQRMWDRAVQEKYAGIPEAAAWTRLLKPPRRADGAFDWTALCIPGDQIGMAVGRALDAEDATKHQPWFTLSLEIGIRFVARPATDWVLQHCRAWVVADGYATGDTLLWDEHGRLCAVATQTANLRPFSPDRMSS